MPWKTEPTHVFDQWVEALSQEDQEHITAAVEYLEQEGPTARMPLSRPIKQRNSCDMRELRSASRGRSEIRILYAFDFRQQAILLLGGDKAGKWTRWYDENVPVADRLFAEHTARAREREAEQPETEPAPKRQKTKHARRKR